MYEGRWSGTDGTPAHDASGRMVTGAHVQGYNSGNIGIALLGTLTTTPASAAARTALVRLLADLAGRHALAPLGKVSYVNPVSGVQPARAGHRRPPALGGHRLSRHAVTAMPSIRDESPPCSPDRRAQRRAARTGTGASRRLDDARPGPHRSGLARPRLPHHGRTEGDYHARHLHRDSAWPRTAQPSTAAVTGESSPRRRPGGAGSRSTPRNQSRVRDRVPSTSCIRSRGRRGVQRGAVPRRARRRERCITPPAVSRQPVMARGDPLRARPPLGHDGAQRHRGGGDDAGEHPTASSAPAAFSTTRLTPRAAAMPVRRVRRVGRSPSRAAARPTTKSGPTEPRTAAIPPGSRYAEKEEEREEGADVQCAQDRRLPPPDPAGQCRARASRTSPAGRARISPVNRGRSGGRNSVVTA